MSDRAASAAPTTPTSLLRPALEAAVEVARRGESAEPPEPAPAALRRFLRFARLPAPALDIARKVIDEDHTFRERVADTVHENEIGEAGWLWLRRPDGWEERLDALRRQRAEAEHHEREERAERDAHRRLGHAEDRARRAEALVNLRSDELDAVRGELAELRRHAAQLASQLDVADAQAGELREQRNQAVRRLKEVEGELARRAGELRQARHEIRVRDAEIAAAATLPISTPAAPAPPLPAATASEAPSAPAAAPPAAQLDRAGLAALVGRAAAAAEQLSSALAEAAKVVAPEPSESPARPTAPAATTATAPVPPPRRTGPRTPVRLPPGVLDDSVAAAEHLCRTDGVLVLVDGYNVSKAAWPSLPIAVQRSRLVDALAELHARTAAEVEVVFDGRGHQAVSGPGRASVRVRFSPDGVEADDVLVELVDRAGPERPVVVVTSDNRVRDAVRRRGGNVVGATQLLAFVGR